MKFAHEAIRLEQIIMQCPKCFADVKYKERSNNVCSKCYAHFAFEPKTHPLQLTDKYFLKVVEKLSNNDKLFFTPQQLQFAVSRKKLKSNSLVISLIIIAFVTTIVAIFIYPLAAIAVAFIWIIVIIATTIYYKKNIYLLEFPGRYHFSLFCAVTDKTAQGAVASQEDLVNVKPTRKSRPRTQLIPGQQLQAQVCFALVW